VTPRTIRVGAQEYPVEIHVEDRPNVRGSIGRKAVYIRLPRSLSTGERFHHVRRLLDWARERLREQPTSPGYRNFRDGEELPLDGARLVLKIETAERRTSVVRREGRLLRVMIASSLDPGLRTKTVTHMISRYIAAERLPDLESRVRALNRKFFRCTVGRVRFKYNRRTWGSCSSRGNINVSTRLIFAPTAVLEYVCIHELAHLKEMNHSPGFWRLVEAADPDYREHIVWLKNNGDRLWF
jgi:predicted metal-dependent hydrolase